MLINVDNYRCSHVDLVNENIKGNTKGCEECEKTGSEWVHLRLCLSCGHMLVVEILLSINTVQNTTKKRVILL